MKTIATLILILCATLCLAQDTLSVKRYIRQDGNDKVINQDALLILDIKSYKKTFRLERKKSMKQYDIRTIHFDYTQNCEIYFFDEMCGGFVMIWRNSLKEIDYASLHVDQRKYYFGRDF